MALIWQIYSNRAVTASFTASSWLSHLTSKCIPIFPPYFHPFLHLSFPVPWYPIYNRGHLPIGNKCPLVYLQSYRWFPLFPNSLILWSTKFLDCKHFLVTEAYMTGGPAHIISKTKNGSWQMNIRIFCLVWAPTKTPNPPWSLLTLYLNSATVLYDP